ncbi:hypothetical protein SmJEL517_g00636 [Synchytrium microbalum]|uniref:Protein HIR n=1 Tax=Synchytrium microbalum TaxID=1806994 RepID=A0A507C962_9FUNG|nr:uncharacterized protein SmJEL517_g00636 [Synchytrium microbalum]TPX37607.1 hypothetical protein SmJEL517_g00636 [Synchytrium microbalum]
MPSITTPPWVAHANEKGKRQAIYSCHVNPAGTKLATGSIDTKIKIWNTDPILHQDKEDDPEVPKLLSTLGYHTGPVVCVRFSNGDGRFLASGSDDQKILIWELDRYVNAPQRCKPEVEPWLRNESQSDSSQDSDASLEISRSPTAMTGLAFGSTEGEVSVEAWRVHRRLVGHVSDVQDMAWAPDNSYLASCGLDSTVIIWDGQTFEKVKKLDGFTGFVKGVTWDPVGKYLGTQSDDKTTRIWRTSDWQVETEITAPYEHAASNTLFRRLSWSPDGSMIVTANGENCAVSVAPVITRDGWKADINLVGHHLPVEVAAFNPVLFQVSSNASDPNSPKVASGVCAVGGQDTNISVWWTARPRSAVATCEAATQAIVDLSWSLDGFTLYACSMDGTVTVLAFAEDELGTPVPQVEIDSALTRYGYNRKKTTIVESARQLELEQENAIADKEQSSERLSKLMNAAPSSAGASPAKEGAAASSSSVPAPMLKSPSFVFPRMLTPAEKELSAAQTKQQQHVTVIAGKKRVQPVFLGSARNADDDVDMTPATAAPENRSAAASPTRTDAMITIISDGGIPVAGSKKRSSGAEDSAAKKVAKEHVQYVLPSVMDATNVPILGIPAPKERILAKIGEPSRNDGDDVCVLESVNDIRAGSSKVTCSRGEVSLWQDTLSSVVTMLGGSEKFFAASCADGSLYIYTHAGRRWLPCISLEGPAVFMDFCGPYLMCLTSAANVHVWNIPDQQSILSRESVAQLLRTSKPTATSSTATASTAPNLTTSTNTATFASVVSATIQPSGIPTITTSDSNSYAYNLGMKVWQKMGRAQDGNVQGVAGILARLAEIRKEGASVRAARQRVSAVSHLEDMVASALALQSAKEYKHWLHQYVRKLGDEGATAKVGELCDDLIGPPEVLALPGQRASTWEPMILGMSKRDLLRELLPTLVTKIKIWNNRCNATSDKEEDPDVSKMIIDFNRTGRLYP